MRIIATFHIGSAEFRYVHGAKVIEVLGEAGLVVFGRNNLRLTVCTRIV